MRNILHLLLCILINVNEHEQYQYRPILVRVLSDPAAGSCGRRNESPIW